MRVAVVNDYELVVVGVAALLEPYRDRVEVVELDSNLPVLRDVDVILYDTFGQVQGSRRRRRRAGRRRRRQGRRSTAGTCTASWCSDSLEAGASATSRRDWRPRSWSRRIERIHAGRASCPSGGGTVNPKPESDWPGKEHGLTVREAEIIALITQGLSNQEIAERSYLSINSVKTYIRTAYRKIGVERRSQAVLWGIKHGFEPDVVRHVQR